MASQARSPAYDRSVMRSAPPPADPDAAALERAAARLGLTLLGGFHVTAPDPGLPPETRTLVLLGPGEPGFWATVIATAEFADGQPDPLDRWSRRVIGGWADRIGARALFPFDGPPYLLGTEARISDSVIPPGRHQLLVRAQDGRGWLEQTFNIQGADRP